jgi:hypothetical protein
MACIGAAFDLITLIARRLEKRSSIPVGMI